MKRIFFEDEGTFWMKGNLHAHSTYSDGRLTPEQLADAYRRRGYDFLAVTDHDYYRSYPELEREDFLMVPGMELTGPLTKEKNGHFCVIQRGQKSDFLQGETFSLQNREETELFLKEHHSNYIFILNHPYWSLLEWEEMIGLEHLTAMEVYNHGSELLCGVGESMHFWNTLLRKGKRILGVAADDSHNRGETQDGWPFSFPYCDSFGGWIMAKTREKSKRGIIEALESGSFYATTGPEIEDFFVEQDRFYVKCSPCRSIVLSGDWGYFQRKLGVGLTEFTGTLRGKEKFVRVQCTDENGRRAWTNPIYL